MNKIPIAHPARVALARESLSRLIRLDREGRIPDVIRGFMWTTDCQRMLRVIHGSAWRAILFWTREEIRRELHMKVGQIRRRFYLTKEERMFEDLGEDKE